MCDFAQVQAMVREAVRRLYQADAQLIKYEVNERSITHWLATYLQGDFPEWNVDCEYNRNELDPKRIPIDPVQITGDDTRGRTVYPDIIVHHRGRKGEGANLLVIEAKKLWTGDSPDEDRRKLEEFGRSEDFAYFFGALLLLNRDSVDIEWYVDGVPFVQEHVGQLMDRGEAE